MELEEFEEFDKLSKYEKVQYFNREMFKTEVTGYVFVDEAKNGELYFLINVSIRNGIVTYEPTDSILRADKFYYGDPMMDFLEEQYKHLTKYEITPKWNFEISLYK